MNISRRFFSSFLSIFFFISVLFFLSANGKEWQVSVYSCLYMCLFNSTVRNDAIFFLGFFSFLFSFVVVFSCTAQRSKDKYEKREKLCLCDYSKRKACQCLNRVFSLQLCTLFNSMNPQIFCSVAFVKEKNQHIQQTIELMLYIPMYNIVYVLYSRCTRKVNMPNHQINFRNIFFSFCFRLL